MGTNPQQTERLSLLFAAVPDLAPRRRRRRRQPTQNVRRAAGHCSLGNSSIMSGTQSGVSGEAIAARLAAWGALHRSLPPQTFFALYFPALKQGKWV